MSIVIYTDGSGSKQTEVGGWAFVADIDGEALFVGHGGMKETTSNRMEMSAAIGALEWCLSDNSWTGESIDDSLIEMHTDSQYLHNGITDWIHGWKTNGWKTAENKDVKNKDLWESLAEREKLLNENHKVTWKWVPRNTTKGGLLADGVAGLRSRFVSLGGNWHSFGRRVSNMPEIKVDKSKPYIPESELHQVMIPEYGEFIDDFSWWAGYSHPIKTMNGLSTEALVEIADTIITDS